MAGIHWPGLLAWSTQYHDGTAPSQFKQMSDEDRKFLEAAMEEAFSQIENPNKMMSEAVQQIKAEDRTDTSITTALEVIDRCCDDPDCARNAEKLDAVQTILDLAKSHGGQIRVRSLEILALLFSNNPSIQEAGIRRGAMKDFLDLVRNSPAGSEDRSKSFRSLVSLVRGVEEYEEMLLRKESGADVIEFCMNLREDPRTRDKAVSFVRTLAAQGRLQPDEVERFIKASIPLLGDNSEAGVQYRETLAQCALALAEASAAGDAREELKASVGARIALAASKEGSDEEVGALKEAATALAAPPAPPEEAAAAP
jgi:hypothetical protein